LVEQAFFLSKRFGYDDIVVMEIEFFIVKGVIMRKGKGYFPHIANDGHNDKAKAKGE
jgi:hypothetical protein